MKYAFLSILLLSSIAKGQSTQSPTPASTQAPIIKTSPESPSQVNPVTYTAGTWQYNLSLFLQSGKRNGEAIKKALQDGNKETVYPYAIQYAIISNDKDLLGVYTQSYNQIHPLNGGLKEYHYNTLMSAEKNAVVYAKGLYDLAPLAVLQEQYGVRKDIQLKYYEGTITEENAYLCLTSGKEVLKQYPAASYSGLLIKINSKNTITELEKLIDNFDLQVLNNASWTPEETALCKNYLPSFILLYRDYKSNNNSKADGIKALILKIAKRAGITETIEKMLAR